MGQSDGSAGSRLFSRINTSTTVANFKKISHIKKTFERAVFTVRSQALDLLKPKKHFWLNLHSLARHTGRQQKYMRRKMTHSRSEVWKEGS
eukprot:6208807-Pyramimonas_sp.AAC.1